MLLENPFKNTTFIKSAINFKDFPKDIGVEIAFAGRSNAGKSTVINTITGIPKLTKTSNTPGRTRTLNFFAVTDNTRIVDLPGFGFAKLSKELSYNLEEALANYLLTRQSLKCLVLIMDSRHPFKPLEEEIIEMAAQASIKTILILNKADKLTRSQQKQCMFSALNRVKKTQKDILVHMFSSPKKIGVTEVVENLIKIII
jgi:GTP-binding protein